MPPENELNIDPETAEILGGNVMSRLQTETCHQLTDDQTAIGHDHLHGLKPSPHPASLTCETPECPNQDRTAASKNIHDLSERAKAPRIYMHAAIVESRCRASFAAGVYAERALTSHIDKSIPWHLRAKVTTLRGFWFLIHYRVAVFALRQAHRRVHQLGLTRVADRSGFLSENCRWYDYFCSFSRLVSSVLFQK